MTRSRKRNSFVSILFAVILATVALSFSAEECEPEDPYLYCGYDCRSSSCVWDLLVPENMYCILTFPGCVDGTNHECCSFSGGF